MKDEMEQAITSSIAARDELRALLRSVVAKDALALKGLYERTSAKLYGICLRLLGDEAEAQDVLQEVYVTVWNKAALFDSRRSSPITWLAALARNRAIDRLRSRGARGAALRTDLDAAAGVADDRPSSFDVLEQAEDNSRLHHCLEQLEEKARAMIRAAFFDGATYPELAERDGVPLPTVKSRIRRGLMRLRGCLEQ
jgi:RNA polymerase sigma-70 factor (ECF subfamily)